MRPPDPPVTSAITSAITSGATSGATSGVTPGGATGPADFPFPESLAHGPPRAPGAVTHALRQPVTPSAVRLAVDKTAVHPQDHPLAVRRQARLPGRDDAQGRVRVYAVNEPASAHPAVPAAGPSETSGPSGSSGPGPVHPGTAVAANSPACPAVSARPPESGGAAGRTAAVSPGAPPLSGRDVPIRETGKTLAFARLLVVGDSLSISLADVLQRRLATTPGLAFARLGRVSSGLARPDFFDWEKHLAEMTQKHRPDTVVVMIGANDNKSLRLPSGKTAAFGTAAWNAEYRRRAARLVDIARKANPDVRVVWLGVPVMGDPGLFRDMPVVNAALAEAMRRLPGCRFVDVWPVLAGPGGRYAEFLDPATRLRAPDGVHLAPAGAARLADACLAALAESPGPVMLSQNP